MGTQASTPNISDALARATLLALFDDAALGLALVRASDWTHVLSSPTYERLLGVDAAEGRDVAAVIPDTLVSREALAAVVSTGHGAERRLVRATSDGSVFLDLTFLRLAAAPPISDGVLVLARDVSARVNEQRIAQLFVVLATDLARERDGEEGLRASVARASDALDADAASIFLLSPDAKRLHGALVGWDWTRTSFVAEIEHWPNVARAIHANEPVYVTEPTALLAEQDWFERRGIEAAICAPMAAGGRVLGVLFFDYMQKGSWPTRRALRDSAPARADLALAKGVADRCALHVRSAAAAVTKSAC